eukprot:TRINITY_DN124761_c0_g1_i1.p1 TRINITY_DN124761_c0_g1~~TRINITY_DN124761_c0_g1_i1.p1  ORF type:complete len:198 (+),score=18.80 TRINITY_DN124761_c0_g1_i1:44-595(+)
MAFRGHRFGHGFEWQGQQAMQDLDSWRDLGRHLKATERADSRGILLGRCAIHLRSEASLESPSAIGRRVNASSRLVQASAPAAVELEDYWRYGISPRVVAAPDIASGTASPRAPWGQPPLKPVRGGSVIQHMSALPSRQPFHLAPPVGVQLAQAPPVSRAVVHLPQLDSGAVYIVGTSSELLS